MKLLPLAIFFVFLTQGHAWALGDWWDFYENGKKLSKKGQWEEALNEHINASILDRKDRRNARTYGLNFMDYFPNGEIGVAYYHLGDNKNARIYLEKSISLQTSKRAQKFLARINEGLPPESGRDSGFSSDSIARMQKEKLNKQKARKLMIQARTAMQRKKPQDALDLARKAELLDPSNRALPGLVKRAQEALEAAEEAKVREMVRKGEIKASEKASAMRKRDQETAQRRFDAGSALLEEGSLIDSIVEFEGIAKTSSLWKQAQSKINTAKRRQKDREAVAVSSTAQKAAKPRIRSRVAVSDFEPIGVDAPITRAVSENLRTAMIETQKYYVLERALLKKVLEQQKMQLAGMTDPSQAVAIGKLMAVRFLALGSLTKLGKTLTINFRFIDVESGRAVVARSVRGSSEDELPDMIDQLVDEIQKFEL